MLFVKNINIPRSVADWEQHKNNLLLRAMSLINVLVATMGFGRKNVLPVTTLACSSSELEKNCNHLKANVC